MRGLLGFRIAWKWADSRFHLLSRCLWRGHEALGGGTPDECIYCGCPMGEQE